MSLFILPLALLGADAIWGAAVSPRSSLFGPVFWRAATHRRLVALTFDDGPDPRWTPRILQTLGRSGIHATFFLEGNHVQAYPQLAREEARDGEELGNHSWDHRDLLWLGPRAIDREIDRTQAAILRASGEHARLFRPPYGHRGLFLWPQVRDRGLQTVGWSLSPWHGRSPQPRDLVNHTLDGCRPGAIILLHDGRGNRGQTVRALPQIIARLKARGYQFVTVSELRRRT